MGKLNADAILLAALADETTDSLWDLFDTFGIMVMTHSFVGSEKDDPKVRRYCVHVSKDAPGGGQVTFEREFRDDSLRDALIAAASVVVKAIGPERMFRT